MPGRGCWVIQCASAESMAEMMCSPAFGYVAALHNLQIETKFYNEFEKNQVPSLSGKVVLITGCTTGRMAQNELRHQTRQVGRR